MSSTAAAYILINIFLLSAEWAGVDHSVCSGHVLHFQIRCCCTCVRSDDGSFIGNAALLLALCSATNFFASGPCGESTLYTHTLYTLTLSTLHSHTLVVIGEKTLHTLVVNRSDTLHTLVVNRSERSAMGRRGWDGRVCTLLALLPHSASPSLKQPGTVSA